jgi:hypothetical protein
MRKLLLTSAAVALVALGSVNQAKAESSCSTLCTASPKLAVGVIGGAAFGTFLVYLAVDDYFNHGGKNRSARASVVEPGAGYQTSLQARLQNSPELRATMNQWANVQAHEALYASAAQ